MTAPKGMNPAELSALIRFHLSEMGAKNAHHEFEHLARHLARARIASNILPATGPVSAGGDRGRDFETFGTHHGAPALPGSRFAERSTAARKLGCVDKGDSQQRPILIQGGFCGGHFDTRIDERRRMVLP